MENPFDLMKNLNKIKNNFADMQEKLNALRETASVGGDMVAVTLNGKMEIIDIKIDPSVVTPDDVSTLQVLIASAFNTCNARMQLKIERETQELLGKKL